MVLIVACVALACPVFHLVGFAEELAFPGSSASATYELVAQASEQLTVSNFGWGQDPRKLVLHQRASAECQYRLPPHPGVELHFDSHDAVRLYLFFCWLARGAACRLLVFIWEVDQVAFQWIFYYLDKALKHLVSFAVLVASSVLRFCLPL